MGRNHSPDCHTNEWTGKGNNKVYDPFCSLCQEDRRREQNWNLIFILLSILLSLLGLLSGVYYLVKGFI